MSYQIKLASLMVVALMACRSFVAVAASVSEAETLRMMHATNQMEIRVGKMAEEKGLTAQTKTFGAHLVKDHTAADAKVKDLAKSEAVDLAAKDSVALKNSNLKESLLIDRLKSVMSGEFDRSFASEMVNGHQDTIRTLEAREVELSGTRTAALIRELLPTIKKHESMARSIQQAE